MPNFKPLTLKCIQKTTETESGYTYRFGNYKSKYRDKSFKKGVSFFFFDYGKRAVLSILTWKPSFNDKGKFNQQNKQEYWFEVAYGRLSISMKGEGYPRIISNKNHSVTSTLSHFKQASKRFCSIFNTWARRNGLKTQKSYPKYTFNQYLTCLSYPAAEFLFDYSPNFNSQISSVITRDLQKAKGANHLLSKIFGSHGKSVKKLLEDKKEDFNRILVFGKMFKGILPLEKTISIIKNNYNLTSNLSFNSGAYAKMTRSFLKNYSAETVFNWLKPQEYKFNFDDSQQYGIQSFRLYENFRDTLNMLNLIRKINPRRKIIFPKTNNITEIHDFLVKEYNKLKHSTIEYDISDYESINNLEFDNFRIEVPANSDVLIEYGQKMGNCIGSYRNYMIDEGLLLGIYKNNELKYNLAIHGCNPAVESKSGILAQFYAKFNQPPDPKERQIVIDKLQELGILAGKGDTVIISDRQNPDNRMEYIVADDVPF